MDYVWFKFTFCQPGITGSNNVPSPGFYNIKLKKKMFPVNIVWPR